MKNSSIEKAEQIVRYLEINRQVGHTTAILEGAKNVDALVIAHNFDWAQELSNPNFQKPYTGEKFELKRRNPNSQISTLSLSSLNNLRGEHRPILLDNAALYVLLRDIVNYTSALEDKLDRIAGIASTR
jgi:hypothetical protein